MTNVACELTTAVKLTAMARSKFAIAAVLASTSAITVAMASGRSAADTVPSCRAGGQVGVQKVARAGMEAEQNLVDLVAVKELRLVARSTARQPLVSAAAPDGLSGESCASC